MAIQRQSGEELDYPEANVQLELGDRLLVVGQAAEIEAFKELAQGEIAVPLLDASCQWLIVPPQGQIAGKRLTDLNISHHIGSKSRPCVAAVS